MPTNFKLLIKKGAGSPAVSALEVAELGFDTTNNNLFVGKGFGNAAIHIGKLIDVSQTDSNDIHSYDKEGAV
jgi:hypothetical protein